MSNTNTNFTSITEKRIKSPKLSIIISIVAILISSIAVITSLIIGGYEFKYFVFPILLVIADILFMLLTIFSNYRFRYSVWFPVVYLGISLIVTLITVLTDGGANGTDLFTHFAIYFFLSVHVLAVLAVAIGYMCAAKLGKKPARTKVVSFALSILLSVAAVVYSYSVFVDGWFGQGALGVERPLEYTLSTNGDKYTVTGVLSGRGDTIVVPETFNGKPVSSLDCSILDSRIKNVYLKGDIDFTGLKNPWSLFDKDSERVVYAKKYDSIRDSIAKYPSQNPYETISTDTIIGVLNSIVPGEIGEGKVYVTFTYTYDDLVALKGKIIPTWVGNVGDTITEDFMKDVDYISHKLDMSNHANNQWSYYNAGKRIYTGISFPEGAGFGKSVSESITNVAVNFEPLYKVNVENDNDTVYEVSDTFKYFEGDKTKPNVFVKSQLDTWLATYTARAGFTLQWKHGATKTPFAKLSDVITDDIDLYPVWTMKAPTITDITSTGTLIYGQTASLSSIANSAYNDFDLSYEWTLDGVVVSDMASFDIVNARPSDSGNYMLVVTSHNEEITSLTATHALEVSLVVNKRPITLDWTMPSDPVYTATSKVVSWAVNSAVDNDSGVINGDLIEFDSDSASITNASVYVFKAELFGECEELYTITNSENSFEITKAPLSPVWGTATHIYDATAWAPSASATGLGLDGSISLIVTGQQRNAGSYTATVKSANSNYEVTENMTQDFTITPYEIEAVWGDYTGLIYSGKPQKPSATVSANYNPLGESVTFNVSGEQINAGTNYTATISLDTTGNYKATNTSQIFDIDPKAVSVSWTNTTLTYNGGAQKPTATFKDVSNKTVTLVVTGEQTDAGVAYTAQTSTDDTNYTLSNTETDFTINPKNVSVSWTNTTLTYNGTAQKPSASFVDVNDDTITLTVSGEKTNAGTNYTATASTTDTNYNLISSTKAFVINPKSVAVSWGSTSTFTYNGSEQKPTASATGVDSESIVLSITGGTNAGNYTAKATTTNTNYTLTGNTKAFVINPKSVAVSWGSTSTFTYNGSVQKPTASATGIGSESIALSITGGTNVGDYTAKATTTNTNYTLTNNTKAFSITKKSVTLTWSNTTLTFNGSAQAPTATFKDVANKTTSVSVSGAKTNVGDSYTATASEPTNYSFTNPTTSFEIVPMNVTISWSASSFTYNGSKQVPTATIKNASTGTTVSGVTATVTLTSGNGTTAGTHTVKAEISNANYNVTSGATKTYTINAKTVTPSWSTGANGVPTVSNASLYNISYYKVENTIETLLGTTAPTTAGNYKVKISLKDSTNYTLGAGSITEKAFTIPTQK